MSSVPVKKYVFGDSVEVYEYREIELAKPAFLVLGLPDAGLVGALATKYLALNADMDFYGEMDSPKHLPPITVVHRGAPYSPLQLYVNSSKNVVALVAESPIPVPAVYPIAKAIVEYSVRKNIDYIVSLSGIAMPNRLEIEKPKAYWISSTTIEKEIIDRMNVKLFEEGFIVGPYAVVLKESKRRGVKNIIILVESFLDFPDPEAAAEAIQVLSRITGITVDVTKLLEEAELIKLQTRELMKQTKKAMSEMKKRYEMQMPLMYT